MRRIVVVGVTGLLGALLVAGCTGTSTHSGSGGRAGAGVPTPANGAVKGDAAGSVSGPTTPTGDAAKGVAVASTDEIITADMTVQVSDVPRQANAARDIATNVGGDVPGDDRTAGKNPSATLTIKVPPARLAGVLDELSTLGTEQERQLSTQDVTTAVADVNSRVASAQLIIDDLKVLLKPGIPLDDILKIENELAPRRADLESLQAQQRALKRQTARATVTLHLVTKAAPVVVHHAHRGFLGGFARGWDAFTGTVVGALTVLGALAPFLVLALPIGPAWLAWRRWRRSAAPTPAPDPS
jgi:hypothetical protein